MVTIRLIWVVVAFIVAATMAAMAAEASKPRGDYEFNLASPLYLLLGVIAVLSALTVQGCVGW